MPHSTPRGRESQSTHFKKDETFELRQRKKPAIPHELMPSAHIVNGQRLFSSAGAATVEPARAKITMNTRLSIAMNSQLLCYDNVSCVRGSVTMPGC